ncbi:MAG: EF-hand domain-containing protein [Oricola sp.]
MKHHPLIAGALFAGILAAGPAAAGNGFGAKMLVNMLFQTGDANGNGRLDPDEIAALRMRGFERADANHDNRISKEEQQAAASRQQRRADMARAIGDGQMDRFDADGDGTVTRAEFENAPRPGFALADIDADGALDRAEMDRILSLMASAR